MSAPSAQLLAWRKASIASKSSIMWPTKLTAFGCESKYPQRWRISASTKAGKLPGTALELVRVELGGLGIDQTGERQRRAGQGDPPAAVVEQPAAPLELLMDAGHERAGVTARGVLRRPWSRSGGCA